MRWPVLYLLQGDGFSLAQQPLVRVLEGSVWTGEKINTSTTAAHLEEAVAAYRAALLEFTRERMPLEWARTQSNLGTALASLGARESGTARFEEAVTALRAALQELTRERVPLEWASTQSNLGTVLEMLSHRIEGDRSRKRRHPP